MRAPTRSLLCAASLAALCLATGELALRVTCALYPSASVLLEHHRVADARLGWRLNPDYPDIDRWGFRNPEVPETADVVVLGDSQTYGYGVDADAAWPRRLQARTGRSVYSVACSGYSPVHGLAVWDSVLALEPRVIVAAVYAGNDAYDTFELVYTQGQLPGLRSADPQVQARIAGLEAETPLEARARRVTRLGRPTWPLRDLLRDHSRIYNLVEGALGGSSALTGREQSPWQAQVDDAGRHQHYLSAFDGGAARRTVFTIPKRLLPQDPEDPRIGEGLAMTLRGLQRIAAGGRAAGADVAVVWIPTKELVFAPFVPAAAAPPGLDRLVEAETGLFRRVRDTAAAAGVAFVDTQPALRQALARGDAPYPITADGHPNERGYAAIAAAVQAGLPDLATSAL